VSPAGGVSRRRGEPVYGQMINNVNDMLDYEDGRSDVPAPAVKQVLHQVTLLQSIFGAGS
jgi:hypothetical protein